MDLIDRFCEHLLWEENRRPSTVRLYGYRCRSWERITGKPVIEVTTEEARAFKRSSYSSSHRKGMLVALRQFTRWARLEGIGGDERILYVRCPKEVNDSPPPLPYDVARELIRACSGPKEFRLIYGGLYAGLRIGESASIGRQEWQHRLLWFRGEKNLRMRAVPTHPRLEAIRDLILIAGPFADPSPLAKAKANISRRTGIDFVPHQLRKTFAQGLEDGEVPDHRQKALLGHAGDVTSVYRIPSLIRLKQDVMVLPY